MKWEEFGGEGEGREIGSDGGSIWWSSSSTLDEELSYLLLEFSWGQEIRFEITLLSRSKLGSLKDEFKPVKLLLPLRYLKRAIRKFNTSFSSRVMSRLNQVTIDKLTLLRIWKIARNMMNILPSFGVITFDMYALLLTYIYILR